MRRNNALRWCFLIAALVSSVWYLYPTYQLESLSEEERMELRERGEYRDLEHRAIKRGLDLQGGMHLVLEVNLPELLDNLAENKDDRFEAFLSALRTRTMTGTEDFYDALNALIASEGIALERYYNEEKRGGRDMTTYLQDEAEDGVNRSLEILRNRVDQFGVSEPSLQKVGSQRIIIELPGIQDVERARELIGQTALLEFKLVIDPDITSQTFDRINSFLQRRASAGGLDMTDADSTDADAATVTDADTDSDSTMTLTDLFGTAGTTDGSNGTLDNLLGPDAALGSENPFYSLLADVRSLGGEVGVPVKNVFRLQRMLADPDVQRLLPSDSEFLWANKPLIAPDGSELLELYHVVAEPELTGSVVTDAQVEIGSGYDPTSAGRPEVLMTMNREGARVWSRVTGAHIDDRIAIVMDDKVFSAPVVRGKIPSGKSQITGMGGMEEAQDLAIMLRAGALPAPVEIIEERTVGPSLGEDSVRKGTWSIIVGFLLVVAFIAIYYKLSGLVALVALFLNILFIFAVLAYFHATLTLPGVAGIILTIGMAIDANVLIFERIREELLTGKTIRACIDAGYDRAIRTILDANITTLIAAIVLYQFGTGPIKGFALTLAIGIVSSLFTAVIVSRLIFDFVTSRWRLQRLSI